MLPDEIKYTHSKGVLYRTYLDCFKERTADVQLELWGMLAFGSL